jgi:hypothetical protein
MRSSSVLILALILGAVVIAQTNRVLEKSGGFTYLLPQGWTVKAVPGFQFKFAFAPRVQDFTSNVNFIPEAFAGSLPDYVAANKVALQKAFKNFKLLAETRVNTKNAGEAPKLAIQDEQQGRELYQAFYFVDAKTKKIVITCTTLPDQRAKLEPQCDALVQSFTLE